MLNDLRIAVHNIKVSYHKRVPRWIRREIHAWAIALMVVAIGSIILFLVLTIPTSKDSYEATKNQNWQQQVADYKK